MSFLARPACALPRDAWFLLLSSAIGSLPTGAVRVIFPLYLHQLGLRATQIGSILTIAGIAVSVLMLAGGPLTDRMGRRPFLLLGTALPMAGFALLAGTTAYGGLVAAALLANVGVVGGLGDALVTDTLTPALTETVAPTRRTALLSWAKAAWALFLGCGMLLAGLPDALAASGVTTAAGGARALFIIGLLITLVATALLLPMRRGARRSRRDRAALTTRAAVRQCRPILVKLTVFYVLQGAGVGLAVQLLPLWFHLRFHVATGAIAPWFAAAQFASVPALLLASLLTKRLGMARTIVLTGALGALALTGVALSQAFSLAALVAILRTVVMALQWPALRSFVLGAVTPEARGTAVSLTMGAWGLAAALLPIPAGIMLDEGLVVWTLVAGVGCYAAAAVWFWATLRSWSAGEAGRPRMERAAEDSAAR